MIQRMIHDSHIIVSTVNSQQSIVNSLACFCSAVAFSRFLSSLLSLLPVTVTVTGHCHTCRAIDTAEIKTCRFNRIMTFFFVLASSTRNNVMAKPSRTKRAQRKRRQREWEQQEEDIAVGLQRPSPIQIQKRPKKKPSKHIQTGCERQPRFKRRKKSNKRINSNADIDVCMRFIFPFTVRSDNSFLMLTF